MAQDASPASPAEEGQASKELTDIVDRLEALPDSEVGQYRDEVIAPAIKEIKRLRAEIDWLWGLLRGVGANRYWEGRWRDEVAAVARLKGELFWLRDRVRASEQAIQFALLGEMGLCWECGSPVQPDDPVEKRARDGLWCLHSNPSLCKFPDCKCPPHNLVQSLPTYLCPECGTDLLRNNGWHRPSCSQSRL